ncbi:MAG: LysE family translocator [Negativicutes bacterium]|nr:LysE family translocator [Negativicutes bacterium]
MFGIVHYEMFLITSILLIMAPGSDTIYILSRSISQGRGAGIYSTLGISAGCAVHTLLAALGLSVLLSQSAMAFMLVKTAGALYLCYLGATTLFAKNNALVLSTENVKSNKALFLQGLITDVLNPKVALFYISFLPQFINPTNAYGIMPFLLLGMTFITLGAIWCLSLVFFSSGVTTFLRQSTKAANRISKTCGGIYLLLGARLLTTEQ